MSDHRHTVLFVEDEPLLHEVVLPCFVEAGFDLHYAISAEEAVGMINQRGAEIVALVSDINLGRGMTGWALARLAREVIVDLPVVYASGGNQDCFAAQGVIGSRFVAKPYEAAELIRETRAAIESPLDRDGLTSPSRPH